MPPHQTEMEETRIQRLIEAVNRGDARAEDNLLNHVYGRLQALTRRMFRGKDRLHRWEQTDDVLQNAMLRLHQAIACTAISSPRHFMNLATIQIRRELIDLGRKHYGPLGVGRNHHTSQQLADGELREPQALSKEPNDLAEWTEFHERVGALPELLREVFDLLYYQGLSQVDAAALLDCSVRTVRRRWNEAKLSLCGELTDGSAGP
jgi:RNA polymerase sigma factor (sigma-70 family)